MLFSPTASVISGDILSYLPTHYNTFEGFHSRFNELRDTPNPNIFLFVNILCLWKHNYILQNIVHGGQVQNKDKTDKEKFITKEIDIN